MKKFLFKWFGDRYPGVLLWLLAGICLAIGIFSLWISIGVCIHNVAPVAGQGMLAYARGLAFIYDSSNGPNVVISGISSITFYVFLVFAVVLTVYYARHDQIVRIPGLWAAFIGFVGLSSLAALTYQLNLENSVSLFFIVSGTIFVVLLFIASMFTFMLTVAYPKEMLVKPCLIKPSKEADEQKEAHAAMEEAQCENNEGVDEKPANDIPPEVEKEEQPLEKQIESGIETDNETSEEESNDRPIDNPEQESEVAVEESESAEEVQNDISEQVQVEETEPEKPSEEEKPVDEVVPEKQEETEEEVPADTEQTFDEEAFRAQKLAERERISDEEFFSKLGSRRKKVPFENKMRRSDEQTKANYKLIFDVLRKYDVNDRKSIPGETISYKKKKLVFATFVGKTLRIYFRIDPKKFENTTIPIKDASGIKKHADLPAYLTIKSGLSARRAVAIAEQVFKANRVPLK